MEPKTYIGFKAWGLGFDAHLTLLYTGELTPDEEQTVEKTISRAVHSSFHSYATRVGLDLFGHSLDTPVVRVNVFNEIVALREYFIDEGLPNPSEFPFNPHITIKLTDNQPLVIPSHIRLSHLGFY